MQLKFWQGIIILKLILSLSISWAAPNNGGGGGSNAEMKDVCEISGGTFTGTVEGNWACCWSDWGCYGCIQGDCKMKCHTRRCKKANGQARSSNTNTLAPGTLKLDAFQNNGVAPVIPKLAPKNEQLKKQS